MDTVELAVPLGAGIDLGVKLMQEKNSFRWGNQRFGVLFLDLEQASHS